MWILNALLAAIFSGITSIFAKIGVNDVDTALATSIRTTIILIFSFIIVLFVGTFNEIDNINIKTLIFLIFSGITTALLWLCYFKALYLGSVNKVTPIDKTSTVLTLILSSIFLNEKITYIKIISIILILIGTYLMVKKDKELSNNKWIFYAILTAIFTSLATILGKIGIKEIDANLGTFIRTIIVFLITWIVVLVKGKQKSIKNIEKKSWLYIVLSGITVSLSWIFYFKALSSGEASIVFPIEKLSIVVTILLGTVVLKEKLNKKSILGLVLILIGTIILII